MTTPALTQKNNARPQLLCPHCKATNLQIRSSEQDHLLLKKIWFQCKNILCGFTCGGNIEITHEISPSATPNSEVRLMTLKEITGRKAANDDVHPVKENE